MSSYYRPVQPPLLEQGLQHQGYSYREYAPCASLNFHVACYWTMDLRSDAGNGLQSHRILPDGCVDIIIDLRSPTCWRAAFVEGLMSRFEVLSLSATQSMFGIRLYSDSAQSILKHPPSAFINQHVFLEEIWGVEGLLMVEEILLEEDVSKMVEIVENKLKGLLSVDDAPSHSLLQSSMKYMYAFKGRMSASDLADQLCLSERHLRRIFHRELGLSPKEMLGIIRFQSMLRVLRSRHFSLADVAVQYGYYDQSHFIKDFKRYYGMLPKQVVKRDR